MSFLFLEDSRVPIVLSAQVVGPREPAAHGVATCVSARESESERAREERCRGPSTPNRSRSLKLFGAATSTYRLSLLSSSYNGINREEGAYPTTQHPNKSSTISYDKLTSNISILASYQSLYSSLQAGVADTLDRTMGVASRLGATPSTSVRLDTVSLLRPSTTSHSFGLPWMLMSPYASGCRSFRQSRVPRMRVSKNMDAAALREACGSKTEQRRESEVKCRRQSLCVETWNHVDGPSLTLSAN